MPNLPCPRLVTVVFGTAVAFGLTAAPALADSTGLRVEEFLPADEQDETPLEDRELLDLAADEDGNLLVSSGEAVILDDDADPSPVLGFEGRTETTPRDDLTSEDAATSDVAVAENGDTYFASMDGAVYWASEDGAPEELVPAGGTPSAIAADSEALYIADGGEISRLDPDAPDDPEPVVDVHSAVSGMHMAGDTLYVAVGDDVLTVEEPSSGDGDAESLPSITLLEEAAQDVTVDEHGDVYAIGEHGVLALSEERMFTEVTGSLIEATAEGIVVGTTESDLLLLRELASNDNVTPSMNWAEHPDLVAAEGVSEDSPGSLHVIAHAPTDSITIDPAEGLTIPTAVPELPEGLATEGTPSGEESSYGESLHHTEDGALWFLSAGTLTAIPNPEQATAPETAETAIMTFGQELTFGASTAPEPQRFRFVAPGEDVLYLATDHEVFMLDNSGAFSQVLDETNVERVRGIAADGDTVHVLDVPSDDSPSRVMAVDSRGEIWESFNYDHAEEHFSANGLTVDQDGTYYLTDDVGDRVLRADGEDVDIIAGATADQTVDGSDAATETALGLPERPMLDGAGNLIFGDSSGTRLLVDAANAPVHPDNDPWRIPRTLGPLVVLALLTAGGVLWWLHRRTQAAEPTAAAENH